MSQKVDIPMRISTFFYCLKQGLKNIYRNRTFSLASIGTITACLFLFGVFYCIVINFQDIVKSIETNIGVTAFFQEEVTEEEILELKEVIALREEVESVTYISAEEAWQEFKEGYFKDGDEGILSGLDEDNPLEGAENLSIKLNDSSKQSELVEYLNSLEEVREVNASDAIADSFTNFSRLLSYISLGIIIILVAVAIFLISNTVMIGITVRKEEIAIMKYIGATDIFVRGPFLVEGIIIGLVGSAIPVLILRFLYNRVVEFVLTEFSILNNLLTFTDVNVIFRILIPVSLGIGLGIGFIGSYGTLRKHVRV